MAKKQESAGTRSTHGKVSMGNVGQASERAAAGRQNKSHVAKAAASRRDALRENGNFYQTKNGDRSSDIISLENGRTGNYAFPGGKEPSAHFTVYDNGTPEKPRKVIRFEGAHRGHPLPGNLNMEVFLPVCLLKRENFASNCYGDWGVTQVEMFQYLTGLIDSAKAKLSSTKTSVATPMKERPALAVPSLTKVDVVTLEADFEKLVNSGNSDISKLLSAKHGDLFSVKLKKEDQVGTILIAVDTVNDRTVAKVKASLFPWITSKVDYYLPLHCLEYEQLLRVTSEGIYAQQCELHAALRWALTEAGVEIAFPHVKKSMPIFLPNANQLGTQPITPAMKQEKAVVTQQPVVPTKKADVKDEVKIDYTKSVKLQVPTLLNRIKEGKPGILVYIGEEGQRAFLWRERTAGVQKLRLVRADDHPTLSAIMDAHPQGVDVDMKNIIFWDGALEEVGDLGDIKNARKHLTSLLHSMLPQMGYKPKPSATKKQVG